MPVLLYDLLWPVVIVFFVACVFVLVTRFIGLALRECEGEWSGKATPLGSTTPPGAPA